MNPFVFVHIPKTAGTSFRIGAERYFGKKAICRDYGPNAKETSGIVREWIHGENDYWKFADAINEEKYVCIAGHFPANKYAPLYGIEQMITFFRDPVQRVISEYRHFVRLKDYTDDFQTFYHSPRFINRQVKATQGVTWPALGFIGTTEKYEESLRLLNVKYGIDIPLLTENTAKTTIDDVHKLNPEDEENIRQINRSEIKLYQQVSQFLQQRIDSAAASNPFVRGMISGINRKAVTGWAVFDVDDDSVMVEVLHNGKVIGEAKATEYRPILNQIGLQRGGYAGFSLSLSGLKANDIIECRVMETGQPLVNSPWLVTEENIKKK